MSVLISGTLLNPAGVVVAGAEITFTALTTSDAVLNGFSASVITNDVGEYAIPLEYGDYTIALQHDGQNTLYGSVSINDKSTPSTINGLLKLAVLEQATTPAIILYFRDIQADVTEKFATMQTLNQSATSAADSAIAARNAAANYAQELSNAVTLAQQASTSAGASANTATSAKNAAEIAAANAESTLADAMRKSANGADIADKAAFRSNLGLGDAALENMSALFRLKGTLGTVDLNDVAGTAYQGIWTQGATANATLARHYPVVSAGSLEVIYNAANNYGTIQRYTTHASNRVFIRYKAAASDAWSAWGEQATLDIPQVFTGLKTFRQNWKALALTNESAGQPCYIEGDDFNGDARWILGNSFINENHLSLKNMKTGREILLHDNGNVYVNCNDFLINNGSVWTSSNLASPATLNTAQTLTAEKIFSAGLQDLVTNIGRTTGPAPVALTATSQLSSMRNGGTLFISAAASTGSLMPGASTTGYWLITCLSKNDSTATAGTFCAVLQGGSDFYLGWLNGSGVLTWKALVNTENAQTITGLKTFTQSPVITAGNPSITLDDSNVTTGTVGRVFRITNNGGILRIFRDPSLSSTTGRTYISFPTAATGTALVSGNNAVADSNGFWKTASPVVKLFADGTSELTSEAEGITTERLSEGVYRISGCLGMNADALWSGTDGGIANPKCRNDLPLIWNDYQVEEDGSIIVRTYHRPHPDAPTFAQNLIEGYESGDPIDVPAGTFVMVRVQMPEPEALKPTIMHSNVYCNTTINGSIA